MRPVVPANLLGLPSACVPAGRDEETGLPIGVLITGRRLREDLGRSHRGMGCLGDVRLSPESDRRADIAACLKGAKSSPHNHRMR
jgi:hypothetical protein